MIRCLSVVFFYFSFSPALPHPFSFYFLSLVWVTAAIFFSCAHLPLVREFEVEGKYSEDDAVTIDGFITYFTNEYNGFGHENDPSCYQSNLDDDPTGNLFKEALR